MITTRTSVTWGDCDPAGVIFYPTMFSWMDRGAHALFREIGIPRETELPPASVLFPVVEAGARFTAPAMPDDPIEVRVAVTDVGRSSFRLEYEIVRTSDATTIARGWEHRVRVEQGPPGRFTPLQLDEVHRASLSALIEAD